MEKIEYTGRVFENTWDCPYCGRKNRGRDRECTGCGSPRGEETKYNHEHVGMLEGKEAERYFKPDWFCEQCETYNSASLNNCKSCGAPRGSSKNYFQIREEQDAKAYNDSEDENHHDELLNKESKLTLKDILFAVFGTGIFIICGLGIASFLTWLFTPNQITGTVTDLTWKTSISLEELTTFKDKGWDLPNNARILDVEYKFKETVPKIDHYETKNVPVTKYRTVQDPDYVYYTYEDMGNGFDAEVKHTVPQSHQEPYTELEPQQVPIYKNVDVYADWYEYEYDKWITIDTETTQGSKGTEHDPVLNAVGSKQRTTDYSRTFRAYVQTEEEIEDFSVSKDLYDAMTVNDTVTLEVSKIGTVEVIEINGIPLNKD